MFRPFARLRSWLCPYLARSLANRLTLAVLTGSFLMLGIVGICSYLAMSALMTRNISREVDSELETVASLLESSLTQVGGHLRSAAESTFVANALVDSEGRGRYLRPFLDDQLGDIHHAVSLALVDFRGQVIIDLRADPTVPPLPAADILQPLLAPGRGHARLLTGGGSLHVFVVQPVLFPQTGTVEGALVGQVDLQGLFEEYIAVFPPRYFHRLLAGDEILLPAHQQLSPAQRFSAAHPLTLQPPFADLDLQVELGLGRKAVFSPLRGVIPIYLAVGAFLLLLAYGLSRTLGRRLARPIVELSRTTAEIAAGRRRRLEIDPRARDETGVLARAFADLVDQLRAANSHLEKQVRRRTDALRSSQALLANIVDNVPLAVGVCEVGPDHRQVLWNRAASGIFGGQERTTQDGSDRHPLLPLPLSLPPGKNLPQGREDILAFSSDYRHPESGRDLVLENRVLGLFAAGGRMTHLVAISDDITERRRSEDLLVNIARGVAAQTGEGFFRSLTGHLAAALGADIAFVGELEAESGAVRTIAVHADGGSAENFTYDLRGTPCERALQAGFCVYRERVAELFPEDVMLADMGIEAYVGAPLEDAAGTGLGILVVLFRHPLGQPVMTENLLRIFAARALGELERRRYEQDLHQSREWLQSIFQNAFSGICTVGLDGTLTGANPVMREMVGADDADLDRLPLQEIFHPEDWLRLHRQFAALRSGFVDALREEARLRRKDGRCFWVELAFTGDSRQKDARQFIIGLFQDISERRQIETTLQLDRLRFEALYRLSQMVEEPEKVVKDFALEEAVRITGSEIGYLYLVDETETRLSLHAWSGAVMDQCHVVDPQTEYDLARTGLWGEALRQRRPIITNDYRADNPWKKGLPAGHVPLVRHLNLPLIVNGRAVLVVGVGNKDEPYDESDIRHLTLLMDGMWRSLQHRRAEEALRASERRNRQLSQQFQALLAGIPDRITLLGPDLKVIWTNHGAPPDFATGNENRTFCYQLWHAQADICSDCPPARAFASGRREQGQIETNDGRTWDVRAIPVGGEGGRVTNVIELAQDITERIRAQEQSIRTAHLASLGELAAGVAHEINNPVNGIINYAEILSARTAGDAPLADLGSRIIREGERISTIVRNLLEFARPQGSEMKPVDVAAELRDSLALIGAQLRRAAIQCTVDLEPDLPPVRANPGQLRQVFLNILSNARQALDVRYPDADPAKVLTVRVMRVATAPHRIRLQVTDYGCGIAEKNLDKVMNPFFTTKAPGKGTGLGLSISHGVVANHGGTLKIESVEGYYTHVRIDLPAIEPR